MDATLFATAVILVSAAAALSVLFLPAFAIAGLTGRMHAAGRLVAKIAGLFVVATVAAVVVGTTAGGVAS